LSAFKTGDEVRLNDETITVCNQEGWAWHKHLQDRVLHITSVTSTPSGTYYTVLESPFEIHEEWLCRA
jgi:hypothetical protein